MCVCVYFVHVAFLILSLSLSYFSLTHVLLPDIGEEEFIRRVWAFQSVVVVEQVVEY